jgi:acyl carrier protein
MHEIQERSGSASIRGIFHCAGVLHGKLLSNIEENDIDIVLKPKVIGSMNLQHVTNGLDLDYFVVSSSINSLIGIPGQSSYGAANCFLADFIDWRRKRGLAGQSILWGPLNVGMASRPEFIDNFAKRGFNLLSVAEVRCCLQAALMQNSTNIVYADINWETMSKNYSVPMMERHRNIMSVLFDQLVSCHETFDEISSFYEFDITSLRDASKQEQYSALTRFVLHAASKVTGEVDPSTSIDVKLTDLGLDSMSILTFINVVQDYTRYRIPAAFMSNIDRTFRDIIQLLAEKLFEQIISVS